MKRRKTPKFCHRLWDDLAPLLSHLFSVDEWLSCCRDVYRRGARDDEIIEKCIMRKYDISS